LASYTAKRILRGLALSDEAVLECLSRAFCAQVLNKRALGGKRTFHRLACHHFEGIQPGNELIFLNIKECRDQAFVSGAVNQLA
jgi:hypothetical protein